MWNQTNSNDQTGQVAARMETTPSLGSASISISQQQAPKKFAPMVAPKPKFNPYKQMGEATHSDPAGNNTGWNTSSYLHVSQLNVILVENSICFSPLAGVLQSDQNRLKLPRISYITNIIAEPFNIGFHS